MTFLRSVLGLLWGFCLRLIGLILASLVAATVMQLLYPPGVIPETIMARGEPPTGWISIPLAALWIFSLLLAPAIVTILFAERHGWRGWRYNVTAFAWLGLAISSALVIAQEYYGRHGNHGAGYVVLSTLAGALGGLAYWLVAGSRER